MSAVVSVVVMWLIVMHACHKLYEKKKESHKISNATTLKILCLKIFH